MVTSCFFYDMISGSKSNASCLYEGPGGSSMYQEIAQLLMYGVTDKNEILYQMGVRLHITRISSVIL